MATETKMAIGGGWISLPLVVRVDHCHPQWLDLLFFFFSLLPEKLSEVSGVWAGSLLFGCLIGCFVLILSLCIFLEMMRCQLVSGGQKILPLCNDCIATALI